MRAMRKLGPEQFQTTQPPVSLGADEIHLWFFPYYNRSRRTAVESATLHRLLASYLQRDATQLPLGFGPYGKPFLFGVPLEFNLAHSADALLVGISRQQPIGVDLESPRRTRPVLRLAERYFDAIELRALAALPESERQIAFLRLWSCKEAVLKALGRGIGFGLNRLVFVLDVQGRSPRLSSIAADAGHVREWNVVELAPASDYCGALAWRGGALSVRAFTMHAG